MIIECPHCDSKVDCNEKGSVSLDPEHFGVPAKVVLLECKICANALLGLAELVQISQDGWEYRSADRLWPNPDMDLDHGIPEIARISLVEAKLCFNAKAYSACAVMCGRAIEGVCRHLDPAETTLAGGLKKRSKRPVTLTTACFSGVKLSESVAILELTPRQRR
jgi:hypothetical protein